MKLRSFICLIISASSLLAGAIPAAAGNAAGGLEVRSVSDFYEPLASQGYWVHVEPYGQCWYPAYIDQGWRPYSTGQWVWSDYGWYWATAEPWGWATYHYGRWVWDTYYGWLWVPDVVWASSWVSWREGGGYIGWAPLTPESDFGGRDYIDAEQIVVPTTFFVFIQQQNFCQPIHPHCFVPSQNCYNQTVNITKIKNCNNVVINQGPSVQAIERISPGKVTRTQIDYRPPVVPNRHLPAVVHGSASRPNVTVAPPVVNIQKQDRPQPTYRGAPISHRGVTTVERPAAPPSTATSSDRKEWRRPNTDDRRPPVQSTPTASPVQPAPAAVVQQTPVDTSSDGMRPGRFNTGPLKSSNR